MEEIKINKVWLTDEAVWAEDADGRVARESFADYPRLRDATAQQRQAYSMDAFGIHWPELDEDLSFEGFFKEKPRTKLYDLFMSHPELNASAIARRLGISQSLFAQYISGQKKPSAERECRIYNEIRLIGMELAAV